MNELKRLSEFRRIALDFPEAPECRRFIVIAARTIYENTARSKNAKIDVLISRLADLPAV